MKTVKRRLELSGYIEVEMSDADFESLCDRIEDDGAVDAGDIRGVDVYEALSTGSLEVTDATG